MNSKAESKNLNYSVAHVNDGLCVDSHEEAVLVQGVGQSLYSLLLELLNDLKCSTESISQNATASERIKI